MPGRGSTPRAAPPRHCLLPSSGYGCRCIAARWRSCGQRQLGQPAAHVADPAVCHVAELQRVEAAVGVVLLVDGMPAGSGRAAAEAASRGLWHAGRGCGPKARQSGAELCLRMHPMRCGRRHPLESYGQLLHADILYRRLIQVDGSFPLRGNCTQTIHAPHAAAGEWRLPGTMQSGASLLPAPTRIKEQTAGPT